jgi:hypothetical protein
MLFLQSLSRDVFLAIANHAGRGQGIGIETSLAPRDDEEGSSSTSGGAWP